MIRGTVLAATGSLASERLTLPSGDGVQSLVEVVDEVLGIFNA